jgi:hypothetical protein
MQAGHMFGDERKVYKEIKTFKDDYHTYFSDELAVAVNICISFFEMIFNIKLRDDGEFYIDRITFHRFRDNYREYLEEIVDDDMGTFDEWANVFLSEHIAYAYNLYAFNPDLSEENIQKNMTKSKYWAEKTIENINVLSKVAPVKENNDHKGILSLFYAYAYRNLYLSCKVLKDEEGEIKWLNKTKKERAALKNNFEIGSIDSQLYDNFSMEYYLTLVEYLNYADKMDLDEDDIEDYKREIEKYLSESKRITEHSKYVERIEYLFKKL